MSLVVKLASQGVSMTTAFLLGGTRSCTCDLNGKDNEDTVHYLKLLSFNEFFSITLERANKGQSALLSRVNWLGRVLRKLEYFTF